MSNGFDPDQDRQFVRPDLGQNCQQRLSAEDKKSSLARIRVKKISYQIAFVFVINVPLTAVLRGVIRFEKIECVGRNCML